MNSLLVLIGLVFCYATTTLADSPVFVHEARTDFKTAYNGLKKALEEKKLWIIFEAHISDNLSRFKKKFGKDYNKNKLGTIRSLVVCNISYVNRVSNLDPDMLSYCPLRIVIVEKKPNVKILFARPSAAAKNSKALPVLKEVEGEIIDAIKKGVK
jgi:uncharacterized protein (DUF302 family)